MATMVGQSIDMMAKTDKHNETSTRVLTNHMIITLLITIIIPSVFGLLWGVVEDKQLVLKICTAISTMFFGYYIYTATSIYGNFFMPYPLFLTATYVYHFGQFIVNLLNYTTGAYVIKQLTSSELNVFDIYRFDSLTLFYTLTLCSLCLSGLQIGALYASSKSENARNIQLPINVYDINVSPSMMLVGCIIVAISIVPAVGNLLDTVQMRSQVAYGLTISEDVADINNVLALALWPGIFLITISAQRKHPVLYVVWLICFMWFSLSLVAGDRSGAVQPLITVFWTYSIVHKKIDLRIVGITLVLLAFVVNPFIAAARNYKDGIANVSITDTISSYDAPAHIQFLDESGTTILTVADTIELVPEVRPFGLGVGYIDNLLIGPFSYFFGGYRLTDYSTYAIWLVETRYPNRLANRTYFGYSFIAEAYLEFGYFAILPTFIFGYIIVSLTNRVLNHCNTYALAFMAILLSLLVHFARGDTGDLGRPLVRYAVLPLLITWIIQGIYSKIRGRLLVKEAEKEL